MIGIRSKVVITGVAALILAGCGSSGSSAAGSRSVVAGSPSANAVGSPSANAAGSPSADAAGSPSGPPDPAVAICHQFRSIEHYMVSQLVAEETSGTAPTSVNWKLMGDGSKMAHWSYVITQAVMNGTTSMTVQFANDLGDASTDVDQSAGPATAISAPDPQTALNDIVAVGGDCANIGITGG